MTNKNKIIFLSIVVFSILFTVNPAKALLEEFDNGMTRATIVHDIAKSAKEDIDPTKVVSNVGCVIGGFKDFGSGIGSLIGGLWAEAWNVGLGLRGGALMGAGLRLSSDGYLKDDNTLLVGKNLLKEGAGNVKGALLDTPDAFYKLGKGTFQGLTGVYKVVKGGKPLVDDARKSAPYVDASCAVL